MRKPNLEAREKENLYDLLSELGLENKGHTSNEFGLNNMTKQKVTKVHKSEQNFR